MVDETEIKDLMNSTKNKVEKMKVLKNWKNDCQQIQRASEEGMNKKSDNHYNPEMITLINNAITKIESEEK